MQQLEAAGNVLDVYVFWLHVATNAQEVSSAHQVMLKGITEGVIPASWKNAIESKAVAAMGRINAAKMFGLDLVDDRVQSARKAILEAIG